MSLFSRMRQTVGGWISGAASSVPNTWHSIGDFYNSIKSLAGIPVNPKTSMSLSVYYACIRNIAEDVGKLPLIVYKRLDQGKERATIHPVYKLLHESPSTLMTSQSLRETITHWALGWGNGYAAITWNMGNVPELHPVHPSRVKPLRSKTNPNEVIYEVKNNDNTSDYINQKDMIHIHGLGTNGITGYSILNFAAESVGLGIAAQAFGATFFGNGANAGTVIQYPGEMGEKAYGRLRESWAEKYVGVQKSHKPIILEEGATFERLSIPPNEAQFLETREFNVEDICRWFRMPIHKVQHHKRAQGWSTIDASNTDYITDTLLTWLIRWEQEIQRKLFPGSEEFFAEHLVTALLRGDMKTRATFYRIQFMNGALSPNDIRRAENMNPVAGGDQYFVPANMKQLDQVGNEEGI